MPPPSAAAAPAPLGLSRLLAPTLLLHLARFPTPRLAPLPAAMLGLLSIDLSSPAIHAPGGIRECWVPLYKAEGGPSHQKHNVVGAAARSRLGAVGGRRGPSAKALRPLRLSGSDDAATNQDIREHLAAHDLPDNGTACAKVCISVSLTWGDACGDWDTVARSDRRREGWGETDAGIAPDDRREGLRRRARPSPRVPSAAAQPLSSPEPPQPRSQSQPPTPRPAAASQRPEQAQPVASPSPTTAANTFPEI